MLTPTVRLSRHLRWRAGVECRRAGETAWQTPDFQALPQWLERCWEHSLVAGGAAGERMLLNAGQFRQASRSIVDELTADLPSNAGAERLVRQARSVAGNWRIGSHDLRAAASGRECEFFADWSLRFAALCRERGWVDPAGLIELLLPELGQRSIPVRRKIVLAGFEYPAAAESRLFERLDELGLLAGRLATPSAEPLQGYRLVYPDPVRERNGAAQWSRARFEEAPDRLIGIIVPGLANSTGHYRRSFLDAFDPLWRDRDAPLYPVSIAEGRRLADSGLVRTAQLLLRVPDGRLDFREIGFLLRSPYIGGWNTEAADRARLDLRLRNDGLQHVNLRNLSKRYDKSGESGPRLFFDQIDAVLRLSGHAGQRREPGNWVEWFESVLRAARFCKDRTRSVQDEEIFEDWRNGLERFASLGEVVGVIDGRHAQRLLGETMQEQSLHRNGRDDGVHLMTPAEAAGMRFDALWICGMTSAAWPGEPRPSPLIPLSLQRARGIPEALPKRFRERALGELNALFSGTPRCVASWSEFDGEEALVSSPQIAFLKPATPEQLGIDSTAITYRESQRRGSRCSRAADPAPVVHDRETIRGGSRLLNLQSSCPARAFFELRLGAAELVAPPFALDAATRGKIAHDAAEFLYAALRADGGPLDASHDVLEQEIAAAIERALDRRIPPMHPLADTLRKNETVRLWRLLHQLVERDRLRGSIEIVELEDRHRIEVGGAPLSVRFDRVDRSVDGKLLVIDYKTGGKFGVSKWLGERPVELQLPLYAAYGNADGIALYWLHAKELAITGMGVEDWGINATARPGKKPFRVVPAADWQRQLADWRTCCEGLVEEFRSGDCRIDIRSDLLAIGEFAMLTRRWSLGPVEEGDE